MWSCLRHDGHPERESFAEAEEGCSLSFRHEGLVPALDCYLVCETGWDRFLASLAALVEEGRGDAYRG